MNKIYALYFVCLISLAWGSGCAAISIPDSAEYSTSTPGHDPIILTTPAVQETHVLITSQLSNMIGDINSHPDQFKGQQVEIVGYYRGWNLLKEAQGTPPVTRSDWVIADNSGAIYVTGSFPQNLDPSSQKDIWAVIRLVAAVEYNSKDVYLKAQSIVLISGP